MNMMEVQKGGISMNCKNCNTYNPESSFFCSNCGAPLEKAAEQPKEERFSAEQPENPGLHANQCNPNMQYNQNQYAGQQTGGNQYGAPGYSQPYGQVYDETPLNNTNSIIAIILNVVIFNIIGLVLAVLSLTSFNDYESALRNGNFQLAQTYKEKSKRYSKIAIILSIVLGAITALCIVGWIVFVFLVIIKDGGDLPMEDAFNEFQQFAAMAALH